MPKSYVLLIDKPAYMTSQDCVTIIKRKLKLKKVGHTGILDPLATGLMVVLVNEATKLSNFILNLDKSYTATMQFFLKTDTGDICGKLIEEQPEEIIKEDDVARVFNYFDDLVYEQIVPIYSAIKKNGKPLYKYARQNLEVELPKRQVHIKQLKLKSLNNNFIQFEVVCSKGTYIRTLVADIAQELGTIATLVNLRRTKQSIFDLEEAIPLADLTEDVVHERSLSIHDCLKKFMEIVTVKDKTKLQDVQNGKPLVLKNVDNEHILLVNKKNLPLAIYQKGEGNHFISVRGFNHDEDNKD